MKKSLLLVIGVLLVASANRVVAQQTPAETAAQLVAPNRGISVVGAINKPGNHPFVVGENVAALLLRAGGATAFAAPQKAYLLRDGVSIPLDLSQPADILQKLILHEGDVLVVPEARRHVLVLGNVAKPGLFPLSEKSEISLVDAIVLAGGALSNPKDLRIAIVRSKPEFTVEWHDWPKNMNDAIFNLRLQDGDGVYVGRINPDSPSAEGGFQLLEN